MRHEDAREAFGHGVRGKRSKAYKLAAPQLRHRAQVLTPIGVELFHTE
jgi:hypothetical protein